MTREQIMELGIEELETRSLEIADETAEADSEKLEELNAEVDAIEERKAIINSEIEERKAVEAKVIEGAGEVLEETVEERTKETMETRNTKEYIEAFANYIKSGDDMECRALLTENVEGVVPVPAFVEGRVRTAWENDEIFSRVTKTFVRGNLKVGFEVSATDAEIHVEGKDRPKEEELVLGIVTMVPQNIKKWITVSDEVLALGAEDFLAYIYDELTYKIVAKAAEMVIEKITESPAESTAEAPAVAAITQELAPGTIIDAEAMLSAEATDVVAIMHRSTEAAIKKMALTSNYAVDLFDGVTVLHSSAMKAYDEVEDGKPYMIVGDLKAVQANLPEGEQFNFKFDDLSLAEYDMVKIVGRLYAAIAVVAPNAFTQVLKGSESE